MYYYLNVYLPASVYVLFSGRKQPYSAHINSAAIIFTHVSKCGNNFMNSTLLVGVSLHTDYTLICSYTHLINEAPGGKSGLDAIVGLHHPATYSPPVKPPRPIFPDLFSFPRLLQWSSSAQFKLYNLKKTTTTTAADLAHCLQPSTKSPSLGSGLSSFAQSHIDESFY